jgi:hypothetical protein
MQAEAKKLEYDNVPGLKKFIQMGKSSQMREANLGVSKGWKFISYTEPSSKSRREN